ncbi:MAG: response regulator [Proteobacteria bacterium]|nr:response regulator [Pseudomonadota bacterium]MBU1741141.1 response regulator [Pseudomonadota bacterium]
MSPIKVTEKILFVDDEPNILESYTRVLRKNFAVDTALGGERALELLAENGPYAVVISDLRMPGLDGITLLSRVKDDWPDTVRIMLTGYADVDSAVSAVNEGAVFRFLTKPCEPETLVRALVAGIKQYRLVTAEKELLEQTLSGSIRIMTDALSMVNPDAFGRVSRVIRHVKEIVRILEIEQDWAYETATMLSQLGCLTLPRDIVRRAIKGRSLSEEEAALFQSHPSLAAEMVLRIPRMEGVSEIIAYQEKHFDGQGYPADERKEEGIPLGSRILKVLLDFDVLVQSGESKAKAMAELNGRRGWYDPAVLTALDMILGDEVRYEQEETTIYGLQPGMILHQDVVSLRTGRRLLGEGQELSESLISSLVNYNRAYGVRQPIKVIVPLRRKA